MKKLFFRNLLILTFIMPFLSSCQREETPPTGKIVSLQTAYDNGVLSKEALTTIAYYYNDDIKPLDLIPYDTTLEIPIKEAALEWFLANKWIDLRDANIEMACITNYYGTYNDALVISVRDFYFQIYRYTEPISEIIDGVEFTHTFTDINPVVWVPDSK